MYHNVFIPKSFFNSLDSLISLYIWRNKWPRLGKAYLQQPKCSGGMALPNFCFYYWAANIRALILWKHFHLHPNPPAWISIEVSSSKHTSLPALLGAPLPLLSVSSSNMIVCHSLKAWVQFRRNFGLQRPSLLCPIALNHLFTPSLHDSTFSDWHRRGITSFSDLFSGYCFASFEGLSDAYNLPATHFFRYLQARHYIKKILRSFPYLSAENNNINNIQFYIRTKANLTE